MARLFTDGAESGDTSRIAAGNISATTGQKRTGNYSYTLGFNNSAIVALPSSCTEFYARLAHRTDTTLYGKFFSWYNGGTEIGSIRYASFGQGIGTITVYDGSGTLRATSSFISVNAGEWHVFELHVKIAASPNGIFTVKFDGTEILNFSGTTNSAGNSIDRVSLDAVNIGYGGGTGWFDDIAINDTSAAVDNSWIGDGGVLTALVPNGAGNYTDLIASAGSAYACVDEIPQNGDTDYAYESTIDKKSTYALSDVSGLPTGASIARVWVEIVAKETAADGNKIATLLRSGSTDSQGSDQNLTLAYQRFLSAEYLTDPADATAWTTTKVNALEAGAVVR